MDIAINPDGPADPLYVLELAEAFAERPRALAHLTRHHSALGEPADADQLLRYLETAVSRLPQLLEQVSGWLAAEEAAGRIRMADGSGFPGPVVGVGAARGWLERAQADANRLQRALDAAAQVTAQMAAVEDGSEG